MQTKHPIFKVLVFCLLLVAGALLLQRLMRKAPVTAPSSIDKAVQPEVTTPSKVGGGTTQPVVLDIDRKPTRIFAHNLMLRKGPQFRVYVRWLRGELKRAHASVNPSFDNPDSFYLDIQNGVLRANIGDIANYFNASGGSGLPLQNVKLSGDGDQIKLSGTFHKIIPLPVELFGTISAAENKIKIHITKINVLKVPFKALLGGLHVEVSNIFHSQPELGIAVNANDILLDTQKLLPAPHIRGRLTAVRVVNPDLEEVYGDTTKDLETTEQWRNFLRLQDGTLDFGKLTMHQLDLIMIDISNDAWFDLDLTHYQDQLVNGYTRITPQAGLQIFMPDLATLPHPRKAQDVSIEWFKNRQAPPPADVTSKK